MAAPARVRSGRMVSASDLAEYAFCPRALYYRRHPDGRSVASDAPARERAGVAYHTRTTRSDRNWAEASPLPYVGLLVLGLGLLALAALGWGL
ncbi:MAG: hypothetical protein L3K18_04245 [Thermoplasmata archaeon]|nr:hypothetical protein [Thermoplasmata archaeon]MCI4356338.1 hypothetical protein [Thermoplasmata archaeon]